MRTKIQQNIKGLIQKEIEAIQRIPIDHSFENAVNLIKTQVHDLNGKVVVSGMGKAGQIGINIAQTLCSTGTPAVYLHPSEAQHGDLGVLCKNDILILLSNSGKTREILELIELSRNLQPNVKIISITGKKESQLALDSNVVLHTGDSEEICPLGLTPTISTTLMTVIGDMIVVELMKLIEFTKKDYSKRHHGGYLGQKSKEINNAPESLLNTLPPHDYQLDN